MQCDLTISEVFQAYYDCRKNKRLTWNALKFEENLETNLMDLYYDLIHCRYEPDRLICFVITEPNTREVWASEFRDRIVHHIFYNRYSDYFYKRMIHDSYACIPGKGTHQAVQRLEKFSRSITSNYKHNAFYLKADFASFFVSIDREILFSILKRHINDSWWLWLVEKIVFNDVRKNALMKSKKELFHLIPKHKSLLHNPGKGLPVGNLSSQFFANIYLNEFDQYVKHTLKEKYYIRYVDDIIILSTDSKRLHRLSKNMNDYCRKTLSVVFNPRKICINKLESGINFVGNIVKPHCKYIRRSTLYNAKRKIKQIDDPGDLMPTVNSYFGHFRNANCFKERKKIGDFLLSRNYRVDKGYTKMIHKRTINEQ